MSEEKKEEYQTAGITQDEEEEDQNICIICRDDESTDQLYKMKCCECYYHKPCFEGYYKNVNTNMINKDVDPRYFYSY